MSIEAMQQTSVFVGTAGWTIPTRYAADFAEAGTHLQRYAQRLSCAEINSSFYRPHRPATYAKWAASAPAGFRFAVKAPRTITHDAALAPADGLLESFLEQVSVLDDRLGPLLFQLPPKQPFHPEVAGTFFTRLRALDPTGAVVVEPRHSSWFHPDAAALLHDFTISRVQADPPPDRQAAKPAGDPAIRYFRLHGSPRMYYSAYTEDQLAALATTLRSLPPEVRQAWVVFDNTAAGEAMANALDLLQRLHA